MPQYTNSMIVNKLNPKNRPAIPPNDTKLSSKKVWNYIIQWN